MEPLSRGKKIVIISVVGLLILALIIFLILYFKDKATAPIIDETAPPPKVEVSVEDKGLLLAPMTQEEVQSASLKIVASMFAEKFGTFSSDSDYVGLQELLPLTTSGLSTWIQGTYIPKLRIDHDPRGYFYRITAQSPVVNIMTLTEKSAKVEVTVQREENSGADATMLSFLQKLTLEMIKIGDNWYVDGAYWQTR